MREKMRGREPELELSNGEGEGEGGEKRESDLNVVGPKTISSG